MVTLGTHAKICTLVLALFTYVCSTCAKSLRGDQSNDLLSNETGEEAAVHRSLSDNYQSCRKSTSMRIPLLPQSLMTEGTEAEDMAQLALAAGLPSIANNVGFGWKKKKKRQSSANNALLTFCLDRVYVDLKYVLDVGTVITDLEIDCPKLPADHKVEFLSSSTTLSIEANTGSDIFGSGLYPGETSVRNADILRILAAGDNCEFKLKADGFDDGLLFGALENNGFVHPDRQL